MIEKVGLLNSGLQDMTAMAWNLYCNWELVGQPSQDDPTLTLIQEFKEAFSRKDVTVHFMGLWDTINSVGIFRDKLFPYTTSSAIVKHVRHAVSIDERRAKFKQLLFAPYSYYPCLFSLNCTSCDEEEEEARSLFTSHNMDAGSFLGSLLLGNTKVHRVPCDSEDIVELFFPGNHGDCGGGWPVDLDGQYLSDIPLRWMLSQAIKFGVIFKTNAIHEFNDKHPVSKSLLSCHHDILSLKRERPIYTQLILTNGLPRSPVCRFDSRGDEYLYYTLFWWLIELLPIGYKVENKEGQWRNVYVPNLGRPRKIPRNSSFHWSVFYRMHYVKDYCPSNIPLDLIGPKYLESIDDFKKCYKGIDVEEYARKLTAEEIKNDWKNKIWRIIPDELQLLLEKD
ncbi:predicted protein, partial [Scheffersomyces stipitis CBS 6054]